MIHFAELLERLAYTPARNAKLKLMADYFRTTPDPDRGWALAALTDGLPFTFPGRRLMMELIEPRFDAELFRMSRDYVGDTAETVALLWPEPTGEINKQEPTGEISKQEPKGEISKQEPKGEISEQEPKGEISEQEPTGEISKRRPTGEIVQPAPPTLGQIVGELARLDRTQLGPRIASWLDALSPNGRWALLKLLTGAPRVGVSARLAKTALALSAHETNPDISVDQIEEVWHGLTPPYAALFDWLGGKAQQPDVTGVPVFRPMMLSHALEEGDLATLDVAEFAIEWKWDGIRIQIACGGGITRLYSRTGEDIGAAFPDIAETWHAEGVFDGDRHSTQRSTSRIDGSHRRYVSGNRNDQSSGTLPTAERRGDRGDRQRPARDSLSRLSEAAESALRQCHVSRR